MRNTLSLFCAGPSRPGRAVLAQFARLAYVSKSAGYQLASLADVSVSRLTLSHSASIDPLDAQVNSVRKHYKCGHGRGGHGHGVSVQQSKRCKQSKQCKQS